MAARIRSDIRLVISADSPFFQKILIDFTQKDKDTAPTGYGTNANFSDPLQRPTTHI